MRTNTFKVGKQYRDTEELQEDTCILEFVKYDKEGNPLFKEISDINCYLQGNNGLIGFMAGMVFFYEHK